MSDRLTMFFEGEPVEARAGQSLAAALVDAGERVFRRTAKDSPRGIFCGMGVCQDCLLEVDGEPNQRACMTLARAGAVLRRQGPRPTLMECDPGGEVRAEAVPADPSASHAIEKTPDVLVVGAGAGGLNAAVAAARAGATVLVLDERKVAGGQYFKQPAEGQSVLDAQQRRGRDLLADARASGAELLGGVEIWGVFEGPLLYAQTAEGAPLVVRPRQLIVATGAYERPRMVPGWTLPGVMTTGAAQTLWRSYRSLPGKRIAVCGSGPLNLQVALELARGGADVLLVSESAGSPLAQPLKALALLLAGPRLALSGLGMLLGLRLRAVPVRYRSELLEVTASADGGIRARFSRGDQEEWLELDALCMNDGFEPQNEVLRLLGAAMRYDPAFGQLRCVRDESMASSVAQVFAVGDCCGLGGAPAAAAEGLIAGRAAALACGYGEGKDSRFAAQERRTLRRAQRFQARLWRLHEPGPRPLDGLCEETLVCRCEELSLGQLRASITAGAADVGAAKLATRVGMGCCQGRYCGPVAARLVAESRGEPLQDHSYFAPRVPIKPVSINTLLATQEALDAKG